MDMKTPCYLRNLGVFFPLQIIHSKMFLTIYIDQKNLRILKSLKWKSDVGQFFSFKNCSPFIFLIIFLLEYSCFTVLYKFLLQHEVNQLYVYKYPLPLGPPSHPLPFPFWPSHTVCSILLVPYPGIERRRLAVKAQSPIHWTPKDVLVFSFFFLMTFHLGNSVFKSSLIYTVMQVLLWMANGISSEASPPNNVIFRNFLICSIMLPVRFHGSSWHRADQPHSKYSNVGILESLISGCWGSRVHAYIPGLRQQSVPL